MIGQRLMLGAKVVYEAGHQIEVMINSLANLIVEALDEHGKFTDIEHQAYDSLQEDDCWIIKSYVVSIPLYKTKQARGRKKPFSWIGFQVTIYNEDDIAQFENWEPSLYVMYSCGEKFVADAFEWAHNRLLEPDRRIWLFPSDEDNTSSLDSWCFVLPLTSLQNEDMLMQYIVDPVCRLLEIELDDIENTDPASIFCQGNPAFRFSNEGERIKIIR